MRYLPDVPGSSISATPATVPVVPWVEVGVVSTEVVFTLTSTGGGGSHCNHRLLNVKSQILT